MFAKSAVAAGVLSVTFVVGRAHPEFPNAELGVWNGDQSAVQQVQDLQVPPAPGDEAANSTPIPEMYYFNPYAEPMYHDESIPEEEEHTSWKIGEAVFEALTLPNEPMADFFARLTHAHHDHPETWLSEEAHGLQPVPDRPDLLVEWNERFLSPDFLKQGFELPTGAIWRPAFWVFGTYRTHVAHFDNRAGNLTNEVANRLDLFGQLNFTGTERILIGLRPLDEEETASRDFTSYDFNQGRSTDGWNSEFHTLFFEGDFGEIFPNLDPYDSRYLDYGFSVGRQPLLAQQGLLINENRIDALTVTRNTVNGGGILNLRATGVYAWNEVNRTMVGTAMNVHDSDAQMFALLTETDIKQSTINADVAYVDSQNVGGDVFAMGLSAIQRIAGHHNTYNTSFHVLASFPTDGETPFAGQGELLFSQISWTPHHTEDLIYLNSFWAIDQYTSATRGTLQGGPLGQTGLLFSPPGVGRFGSPLDNSASSVVGGSLGYQMFYDGVKQQVIVEVGGRKDTNDINEGAIGTGMRYQRALNQHWIVIVDGFVAKKESVGLSPGTRLEFLAKF